MSTWKTVFAGAPHLPASVQSPPQLKLGPVSETCLVFQILLPPLTAVAWVSAMRNTFDIYSDKSERWLCWEKRRFENPGGDSWALWNQGSRASSPLSLSPSLHTEALTTVIQDNSNTGEFHMQSSWAIWIRGKSLGGTRGFPCQCAATGVQEWPKGPELLEESTEEAEIAGMHA